GAPSIKNIEEYKEYLADLFEVGEGILDEKISSGLSANANDFITAFVRFMIKFLDTIDDPKYFVTAKPNLKGKKPSIYIEITCLDPKAITMPILDSCYASISCSGTVNDDAYIKLVGLNDVSKPHYVVEIRSPFPKKNIIVLLINGVSTKAALRTDKMYKKMNEKIAEVIFSTPGNVGVFCASYSVLKGLLDNGLEDLVRFSKKKLFIEEQSNTATDNNILIEDYKSESKRNGAVLLGVAGGRNSEGEDFPGDYMNAVIIVGFPFPRPTPTINARIDYYNKIFPSKGRLIAYTIPAIQRSNQACGRPIRRLDDKGAIILLDDRFKYYNRLLSTWIRENIEIVQDQPNIIQNKLEQFFKSKKEVPNK
ncbi:MAG: helicase C-terminal domain-containing protein, partial [Promethearchaeota archaeon]